MDKKKTINIRWVSVFWYAYFLVFAVMIILNLLDLKDFKYFNYAFIFLSGIFVGIFFAFKNPTTAIRTKYSKK